MNVELLRKAAAMPVIMRDWFTEAECGTVGCIAGNICLLSGEKPAPELAADVAAKLAGIPAVNELFYTDEWPYEFSCEYEDWRKGKKHNSVVPADLISRVVEDYIATDGWTK